MNRETAKKKFAFVFFDYTQEEKDNMYMLVDEIFDEFEKIKTTESIRICNECCERMGGDYYDCNCGEHKGTVIDKIIDEPVLHEKQTAIDFMNNDELECME